MQVGRELPKVKMHGLAASLGGSSARPDPKTQGLLIELPHDASFAKQNLERQDNRKLLVEIVERLHGTVLPLTFVLGPDRKQSASAFSTELFAAPEEPKPSEPPESSAPFRPVQRSEASSVTSFETSFEAPLETVRELPIPASLDAPLDAPTAEPKASAVEPEPPASAAEASEALTTAAAPEPPAAAPETPESPAPESEPSSSDELSPEDIIFASFGSAVTVREVDE
jgi:hypothetical protein